MLHKLDELVAQFIGLDDLSIKLGYVFDLEPFAQAAGTGLLGFDIQGAGKQDPGCKFRVR